MAPYLSFIHYYLKTDFLPIGYSSSNLFNTKSSSVETHNLYNNSKSFIGYIEYLDKKYENTKKIKNKKRK